MNNNIPPQAQQLLVQMQTFQQQFQTIMMQKESFSIQKLEIEKALEELEKSKGKEVYKAVGPILIKSTRDEMLKELREKQETIGVRLKSIDAQETKIREKMDELQAKLQEMMQREQKSEKDGEAE